jgi:hypothetical protein
VVELGLEARADTIAAGSEVVATSKDAIRASLERRGAAVPDDVVEEAFTLAWSLLHGIVGLVFERELGSAPDVGRAEAMARRGMDLLLSGVSGSSGVRDRPRG